MYIELLCQVLSLAEQLLFISLKRNCENVLVSHSKINISFEDSLKNNLRKTLIVTKRTVCQLLEFSHINNAEILFKGCITFIARNIAYLLESKLLNDLPTELRKEVSDQCKKLTVIS